MHSTKISTLSKVTTYTRPNFHSHNTHKHWRPQQAKAGILAERREFIPSDSVCQGENFIE
jgi:hypothetical protein